ncbi:MAG TPA: DUF2764 family protein [Candidatus Omnitrophota bacterium]|nr:DUF2764 family protein [Candidatus Omnitrophota bacterium]
MSAYYFLMASLPMLHFGAKPPFSFQRFLQTCQDAVGEKDLQAVRVCARDILAGQPPEHALLRQWLAFEIELRNELVKIRASRKKLDPASYLRPDGSGDIAVYHSAMNSHRIPSLIESELFLDQERWRKLDELAAGHFFDLEALLVYALQLRILWRWEHIAAADKNAALEQALAAD